MFSPVAESYEDVHKPCYSVIKNEMQNNHDNSIVTVFAILWKYDETNLGTFT